MYKTKLLFICTGNRDRSPMAADLFRNSKRYEARSAGTHLFAVQRVTQELIDWADKIFVMSEVEDGHLTFLTTHFKLQDKMVCDLGTLTAMKEDRRSSSTCLPPGSLNILLTEYIGISVLERCRQLAQARPAPT